MSQRAGLGRGRDADELSSPFSSLCLSVCLSFSLGASLQCGFLPPLLCLLFVYVPKRMLEWERRAMWAAELARPCPSNSLPLSLSLSRYAVSRRSAFSIVSSQNRVNMHLPLWHCA